MPIEFFDTIVLEGSEKEMIEFGINLKMKFYDNPNIPHSFIYDLPPPER